jgi:hypothetical protein
MKAPLLAGIPDALRVELLSCYRKLITNFRERRWEASELNGGQFCEIVFSILRGVLVGSFPAKAGKPKNMVDDCRALENFAANPARVGDRSIRVLIPRMLPVLYEVRNNRNVGHVGGEVDPNHQDAIAVVTLASWIMAELVRIFHDMPLTEAQAMVDALVERHTPLVWEVEDGGGVKRVLDARIGASDVTIVLLYSTPGWLDTATLLKWTEYKNATRFHDEILGGLHRARHVEFDRANARVRISPTGIAYVEDSVLRREPKGK